MSVLVALFAIGAENVAAQSKGRTRPNEGRALVSVLPKLAKADLSMVHSAGASQDDIAGRADQQTLSIAIAEIGQRDHHESIRLFSTSNFALSSSLTVSNAYFPRPIQDGCGGTFVFWLQRAGTPRPDSTDGIWYARHVKGRWNTPRKIDGTERSSWSRVGPLPVRLPRCRVALATSTYAVQGGLWQHYSIELDSLSVESHFIAGSQVPVAALHRERTGKLIAVLSRRVACLPATTPCAVYELYERHYSDSSAWTLSSATEAIPTGPAQSLQLSWSGRESEVTVVVSPGGSNPIEVEQLSIGRTSRVLTRQWEKGVPVDESVFAVSTECGSLVIFTAPKSKGLVQLYSILDQHEAALRLERDIISAVPISSGAGAVIGLLGKFLKRPSTNYFGVIRVGVCPGK